MEISVIGVPDPSRDVKVENVGACTFSRFSKGRQKIAKKTPFFGFFCRKNYLQLRLPPANSMTLPSAVTLNVAEAEVKKKISGPPARASEPPLGVPRFFAIADSEKTEPESRWNRFCI